MLSSAAQATAPCHGKNGRAAVERELFFFLIHQTGGVFVTAQDSCDMRDRLLRYFATCGQEKPLSGNLKRGEKTPENG